MFLMAGSHRKESHRNATQTSKCRGWASVSGVGVHGSELSSVGPDQRWGTLGLEGPSLCLSGVSSEEILVQAGKGLF